MIAFPLRLVDLEPEWVRDDWPVGINRDAELTIATAQGVLFIDPVEFIAHQGPIGASSVLAWFKDRGVPDEREPGPGRWTVSGTGFHDLTLSPSIDLTMNGQHPGYWHGFVTNGQVT